MPPRAAFGREPQEERLVLDDVLPAVAVSGRVEERAGLDVERLGVDAVEARRSAAAAGSACS